MPAWATTTRRSAAAARRFVFNIAAICPVPELLPADREWVRAFWEAMRPHSSGAASYVNFMTDIEADRVQASYGAAKYERLAGIKAEYDPDNAFHRNANIRPTVVPA
jgi:Berberine and berberine like